MHPPEDRPPTEPRAQDNLERRWRIPIRLSYFPPFGPGPSIPGQALVVPEIIQTSALDCGPAALKCLLGGLGIQASYDRLREACQTSLDGTSIDALEEAAVGLGLEAEQVLVPSDHLLFTCSNLLPAIVVVKEEAGLPHFVVVWSRHGPFLQLMDPAVGRRWIRPAALLPRLFSHEMAVPAASWRAWAESDDFIVVLKARMCRLGFHPAAAGERVTRALRIPGWRALAALDGATRFTAAMVQGGGPSRGREAQRVLDRIWEHGLALGNGGSASVLPERFWTVRAANFDDGHRASEAAEAEEAVIVRGAVVVRVRGRRSERPAPGLDVSTPPALSLALEEGPVQPWVAIADLLRRDGCLEPAVIGIALLVAASGTVAEALLLRGLLEMGSLLGAPLDRAAGALALAGLVLVLGILDWAVNRGELRLGRRLEIRFRLAFLSALATLPDHYFRSRLVSDMAERVHRLATLKSLTQLGGQILRLGITLAITTAAIAWLDPSVGLLALLIATAGVGIPFLFHPWLAERDLRLRSHAGALGRFHLDALLGLVMIRSHGGESAIRRQHENLLRRWIGAGVDFQRGAVLTQGMQAATMFVLVAVLVLKHLAPKNDPGSTLLLIFWALQLPVLGQQLAFNLRRIPEQRSIALRLLEPMVRPKDAAERPLDVVGDTDHLAGKGHRPQAASTHSRPGAHLSFDLVDVRVGGHLVLREVTFEVAPGTQVAVVGASGAGKSTLAGLLLGFHQPERGVVRVDGERLDAARLARLRRETAWVDPASQLWNRSLIANLTYGLTRDATAEAGSILGEVGIDELVSQLPDGLQTALGEGGGLLSGGEGQRIRIGRARLRPAPRLVLLDEPFRGLDRATRRELLARSRRWWADATMLVITHDLEDTRSFDQVVILEDGVVCEVGDPHHLASTEGTRYQAHLARSKETESFISTAPGWRRIRIEDGQLG
jgi:ATP-binding cassette subfamily B protein